ncbi:hypothetical protein D3C80_1574820 [compost metagenome]
MKNTQLYPLYLLRLQTSKAAERGKIIRVNETAYIAAGQLFRLITKHLTDRRRAIPADLIRCGVVDDVPHINCNQPVQLIPGSIAARYSCILFSLCQMNNII